MTDDDLRRAVAAELCWDPRVDSAAIEVSAADGLVTLRGTVASLWHKRAGGSAAARVRGVSLVANGLRVQIPDRDRRDDDDLRGTVDWHYQREAAESRTASVPGVVRIDNAIALAQVLDARAAGDAINLAFRRDAVLDAERLAGETVAGGRAL